MLKWLIAFLKRRFGLDQKPATPPESKLAPVPPPAKEPTPPASHPEIVATPARRSVRAIRRPRGRSQSRLRFPIMQQIATYQELYVMILTTYGGDGETIFAMPDLRGKMIVGPSG